VTNRRGVALLTALWLVVAIAVVVLEFSLEAKERRQLGVDTAERGIARAADAGALAVVHAKLDYALRTAPNTGRGNIALLRSSDPWLGVDSLYSGSYRVDSIDVDVKARDLGTQLNLNNLTEAELRTFFGFVLNDYETADKLAQAIMDWRDADDIPRARGAERDDYVKAGLLTLPQNGPIREVEDLLQVMGMTPEIYAIVQPYFTTRGTGFINLNTAPPPVLRVLPGMTDAILGQIIALRSSGRRISSVDQVLQATRRGRPATMAQAVAQAAASRRLQARATVDTREVELTIIARATPQSQPARLLAIVERADNALATIEWKQW
jgi:general secretion pathway protein K